MSFADRLIKIRKKRGITQRQLATISGMPPASISHFERGARKPNFNNLLKLVDALCCNTDYLIGHTEKIQARGPIIDKLAKNSAMCSRNDLEVLATMADSLAKKNQ